MTYNIAASIISAAAVHFTVPSMHALVLYVPYCAYFEAKLVSIAYAKNPRRAEELLSHAWA